MVVQGTLPVAVGSGCTELSISMILSHSQYCSHRATRNPYSTNPYLSKRSDNAMSI